MRSYFDVVRAALERHGGAVEKFIGDAVVGMFGVPETNEDDALRACRAALEIQDRIASLNVELKARLDTRIAVRIGVNTGEVVAGDAARREMFRAGDAVVLGDAVNLLRTARAPLRRARSCSATPRTGSSKELSSPRPLRPFRRKGSRSR